MAAPVSRRPEARARHSGPQRVHSVVKAPQSLPRATARRCTTGPSYGQAGPQSQEGSKRTAGGRDRGCYFVGFLEDVRLF
eukprot:8017861-Pyramimonas_sp.AAC.1